jgi:ABC-type multidrug transport system fused ATPase/permease subunit
MLVFRRFRPFLRPYLPRMVAAGLLVMAVAAINLALLRLAGSLWDVITVQHDAAGMTRLIGLFLGLVVVQGFCSMGVSVTTDWMIVTSFISRESNSPVRRRAKKPTDRVCKCPKRCRLKSATMRCDTHAVR